MPSKINLIHGDCMDFMKDVPDNFYELAIVDPPYGLGGINFNTRKFHKEKDWNKKIPPHEYFNQLYRISKNQIIWGCNYYINDIIHIGRIVFNKMIPNHGMQNFSDCDLASQSFNRIIKLYKHEWRGNVQNGKMNIKNKEDISSGIETRIHPTQKPVALYKWLLHNYAKEGDKILDTHGGSMSIAIACYDMGFDLDCIEIDKEYYDAGVKRFENHRKQLTMEF